MKTIKLTYSTSEEDKVVIKDEIRKSSSVVRYAFNRFRENKTEKEIRFLIKDLSNISSDSWFNQCAIKKAEYLYVARKTDKVIFGGKFNFIQRLSHKISNEEIKELRQLAIYSQGEKLFKGNRKFELDIKNNKIIFKLSKNKHIDLLLPKLRQNYLSELTQLEELSKNKKLNFSVELNQNYISITFDDSFIIKSEYVGKSCRVAGIDMNPNYIGINICEFSGDKQNILHLEVIDVSELTKKLGYSSDDKRTKHQNNKQNYELTVIAKYLIEKAKYFKVSKFVIEDLNLKSKDSGKGEEYNRLTNNKWKRNILVQAIRKQCLLNNLKLIEINPAYTSFIGNLMWNKPDMLAASLEISRRGYFQYAKGKFYPELITPTNLLNRWKESANWCYSNWVELYGIVKTSELKYRRSLDSYEFKVFRFSSDKSDIKLYSFI